MHLASLGPKGTATVYMRADTQTCTTMHSHAGLSLSNQVPLGTHSFRVDKRRVKIWECGLGLGEASVRLSVMFHSSRNSGAAGLTVTAHELPPLSLEREGIWYQ